MAPVDVGVATEKAMEQARKAGVPLISAVVTDVSYKAGDWVVTISTGNAQFQAIVDGSTGAIRSWKRTWVAPVAGKRY